MSPKSLPGAFSKAFRSCAAAAVPAVLAAAVLAYELHGFSSVHGLLADFRAFVCAGSAVAHGSDPYASAALAACERVRAPWGLYAAPANMVLPAPLPPYAIALFAPFAYLNYPAAAIVWFAALMFSVLSAAALLIRRLRLPAGCVAFMLLLPAAVLWLPFGELAPVALLGAVLAAVALDRPALAAFGLVLLAAEPHVAAGAWIAAALFVPRIRVPLAIAGCALVALSFAVHPGVIAEYLGSVLPLHALAELPRPSQYSAAWGLYALGAPAAAALAAGSATYIVLLVAGIVCAGRLRRKWDEPAVVIFAPMAFAVLGGTFVHLSQIALALPFAALLATRERGAARTAGTIACAALAVPWLQGGPQQTVVFAGAVVAASIVFLLGRDRALAVRALFGATALAALLVLAQGHGARATHARAFPAPTSASALASASWGRYVWKEQSAVSISDWLGKAPSWTALLLLIGGAALAVSNKEPESLVAVREMPAVP